MKLIDKSALVAEIESLRCTTFTNFDEGVNATVQILLETLDTLEVKEVQDEPVSEELEEAARRYAALQAGMKDAMTSEFYEEYPYSPNDVNAFKAGAEWQKEQDQKSMEIMDEVYFKSCDMIRKQMIAKACKYLQDHREEVETEDNGISGWISDEFIEDFENYMKG